MTPKKKLSEVLEESLTAYADILPEVRKQIIDDAIIGIAVYLRDISKVDLDTFLDSEVPEEIV
jgi:hypothetical protein